MNKRNSLKPFGRAADTATVLRVFLESYVATFDKRRELPDGVLSIEEAGIVIPLNQLEEE